MTQLSGTQNPGIKILVLGSKCVGKSGMNLLIIIKNKLKVV